MDLQIKVPTDLSEITLKDYQTFVAIQKDSNDEEFVAQKMIEIFCGIKLSEVAKIKLKSLNEMVVHFTHLFTQKPKFQSSFKIGELEFGFIPDLEEITFGEYVDLENHMQNWDDYHKAMSVLYRPIKAKRKDKYDIIDYEPNKDFQDLMKFAPLDVCIASSVFFWTLESELLQGTLNYLENQMEMEKSTTLAKELNLLNGGDGIKAYMHSLRATLQSLTTSPHLDLLNALPILHSRKTKQKLKTEKFKEETK